MEWLINRPALSMIVAALVLLCLAYAVFAVPAALLLWGLNKRLRRQAEPSEGPQLPVLKTVGIGFCVFMITLALCAEVRQLLADYILPDTSMFFIRTNPHLQRKMNSTQSAIFEYCRPPGAEHAYDLMNAGILSPTSPAFEMLEKSYSDCVNRWPSRLELLLLYGPVCLFVILRARSTYRQGQGVPESPSRVGVWPVRLVVISGLAITVAIILLMGYFPTLAKDVAEQISEQNARQHGVKPLGPARSPAPSVGATTAALPVPAPSQPTSTASEQAAVPGAWNIASVMRLLYGAYDPVSRTAFWNNLNPPADKHFDLFSFKQSGTVELVLDAPFTDGTAQKRFVVTATSPAGEWFECHACMPFVGAFVFAHSETGWVIESQERFLLQGGGWGKAPTAELAPLADGHYGVKFSDTYAGQGETSTSTFIAEPVGSKILISSPTSVALEQQQTSHQLVPALSAASSAHTHPKDLSGNWHGEYTNHDTNQITKVDLRIVEDPTTDLLTGTLMFGMGESNSGSCLVTGVYNPQNKFMLLKVGDCQGRPPQYLDGNIGFSSVKLTDSRVVGVVSLHNSTLDISRQ
jgi:hypothetical protein